MVKVIHKKDKKYLDIDGREYGPRSLYFHIKMTMSTLEYFTKTGYWDENKQEEVRRDIQRLMKIYWEYYPKENELGW